jgi:hypothetical protein
MKAVLLCDREKWTWQQYREQPQWFITSLLTMIQNEAEQANRRSKQT